MTWLGPTPSTTPSTRKISGEEEKRYIGKGGLLALNGAVMGNAMFAADLKLQVDDEHHRCQVFFNHGLVWASTSAGARAQAPAQAQAQGRVSIPSSVF